MFEVDMVFNTGKPKPDIYRVEGKTISELVNNCFLLCLDEDSDSVCMPFDVLEVEKTEVKGG